jgi:hypothetical protein
MKKSSSISILIQNFKDLFDKNPVIIVIGIIVFFISSITTIINDGTDLMYKANSTIGWRGFEEKVINSLNASIRIEKFIETLGEHVFYREGEHGYSEYVFERRDGRYWIQAITNKEGTVVIYSVTSCDSSFKPQIKYSPTGRSIRLAETTFKEAANGVEVSYDYYVSAATSNSYLIENDYAGNPGMYQTEYWGIIDSCDRNGFYEDIVPNLPPDMLFNPLNREDPILHQFRETFAINTYAVSAPFVENYSSTGDPLDDFQIGVDRIQIRVVYPK